MGKTATTRPCCQLERIDLKDPDRSAVTVSLKGGSVFSGTVDRISRYPHGPRYYCFANLAWYDADAEAWIEQGGNIIVERSEIEYIVTPELMDQQSKPRLLPKIQKKPQKNKPVRRPND